MPRLYGDLAEWYPLLTPVGDYVEEAAFYRRLFEERCRRPPRTLLDLGSGGGHNAAHLKATLACTLVDLSPAMLAQSRRLNPECEHVQGDMRALRLGRGFDCVLVHDAVSYMASRADLRSAIGTAFAQTVPGGVALFQPDFVAETFEPGTETGGSDGGRRGLRYLEWRWVLAPSHETYVTDMAYLLRDETGGHRLNGSGTSTGDIPSPRSPRTESYWRAARARKSYRCTKVPRGSRGGKRPFCPLASFPSAEEPSRGACRLRL